MKKVIFAVLITGLAGIWTLQAQTATGTKDDGTTTTVTTDNSGTTAAGLKCCENHGAKSAKCSGTDPNCQKKCDGKQEKCSSKGKNKNKNTGYKSNCSGCPDHSGTNQTGGCKSSSGSGCGHK